LEKGKKKFKFKYIYKPFIKINYKNKLFTELPVYSEELFNKPSILNTKNFISFNNELNLDSLENNYELLKNIKLLYNTSYQNVNLNTTDFLPPIIYSSVINAFRADFDEGSWDFNQELNLEDSTSVSTNSKLGLTNTLKLRSTAKNSIVTYNAIQKVYKSRFDEGRANTNFSIFQNSFTNYPFLTESKTSYENLLGKNKESFFNTNLYNVNFSYSQSANVDT
jgi:hypothetical protein